MSASPPHAEVEVEVATLATKAYATSSAIAIALHERTFDENEFVRRERLRHHTLVHAYGSVDIDFRFHHVDALIVAVSIFHPCRMWGRISMVINHNGERFTKVIFKTRAEADEAFAAMKNARAAYEEIDVRIAHRDRDRDRTRRGGFS